MIGRICKLLSALALAWPSLAAGERASSSLNLAAGLTYDVSPAPNYPGAGDSQRHVATDGRRSGAVFSPADAIGWNKASPVTITLDLQRVTDFDRVVVSSIARPAGDLHHPAQIILFAGAEREQMRHIANIAPEARAEKNGSKSSSLSFAPIRARFVSLVLYPRGDFLLIDEIEIDAARDGVSAAGELAPDAMRQEAARIRSSTALAMGGPIPAGAHPARRWAAPLAEDAPAKGCEIRRVNPWDDFHSAGLDRLALVSDEPLVAPANGEARAAWVVINGATAPASLDIGGRHGLDIDALSFVQADDLSWVADVPSAFQATLLPPRSAMVLFAHVGAQESRADISLDCAGARFESRIEIDRIALAPQTQALSGTLWPYLRGPARPGACARDLLALSGSDTAVVPPYATMKESAEGELRLYLREFRHAKSLRLFMDLAKPEWSSLLPPENGDALLLWWMRMKRIAQEEGFAGELTPYPFDEIKQSDIPRLATFAAAIHAMDPSARIFGTIDNPRSAEALKHLDVAQVLDRPDLVGLPDGPREFHLYATKGAARSLSPYGYYRLQGWKAYARGHAGVGFWSLWETSGAEDPESGWSLFGGEERDYGAIYRDFDGCPIASRRLHAWRQGLEDHQILKSCESRIGRPALAGLVRSVIAHPGLPSAADDALAAVAAKCRN